MQKEKIRGQPVWLHTQKGMGRLLEEKLHTQKV
jgi:hypothetical protein